MKLIKYVEDSEYKEWLKGKEHHADTNFLYLWDRSALKKFSKDAQYYRKVTYIIDEKRISVKSKIFIEVEKSDNVKK